MTAAAAPAATAKSSPGWIDAAAAAAANKPGKTLDRRLTERAINALSLGNCLEITAPTMKASSSRAHWPEDRVQTEQNWPKVQILVESVRAVCLLDFCWPKE